MTPDFLFAGLLATWALFGAGLFVFGSLTDRL